jgi:hypothetical protein
MYQPTYDTTIRTSTVIERHNTLHHPRIDWEYPFEDWLKETGMCGTDEQKRKELEKLKDWLRTCEQCDKQTVYASNYGGMPRIWQRVLQVGMGSAWPRWTPRPCVIVEGPLGGTEWFDWSSLTGVRVEE